MFENRPFITDKSSQNTQQQANIGPDYQTN
jgi:hypothetical protein